MSWVFINKTEIQMKILTIINTALILFILRPRNIKAYANKSTYNETLLGYGFYRNGSRFFYLPIRNGETLRCLASETAYKTSLSALHASSARPATI